MSKKFRRFYETAFDSKISKSDEDLLSADKEDAAIAHRMSNQLQLSASTSSVQQLQRDGGRGRGVARVSTSRLPSCKHRLFGFLLTRRRNGGGGGGGGVGGVGGGGGGGVGGRRCNKYPSSDSVVTSSSLSLESITSDSLSSHSSESPCYRPRFPEPHVLSPISDKSSLQDVGGAEAAQECVERRMSSAAAVAQVVCSKARPPQSLGLIKLNGDHRQHHGSDSGISVGSKPGDSYQELPDVPFDMPKLRRKQKPYVVHAERPSFLRLSSSSSSSSSQNCAAANPSLPPQPPQPPQPPLSSELPFDMPKLRRRLQTNRHTAAGDGAALPFDMPKLRKKQMDSCARVISLEFGGMDGAYADPPGANNSHRNEPGEFDDDRPRGEHPLDVPKLKTISFHDKAAKIPDRSSLFLDVTPVNCVAADTNTKPLLKTFQNKNQLNRPTLSLCNIKPLNFVEDIDVSLSLDQQCWYHGPMNRLEAEKVLHGEREGSYLVRGTKGSYALSIKSAKGFIHIRIIQSGEQNYLGQSDKPFDTIPDLIRHYTLNKLPAKGAEHVGLIRPLAHQIL